MYIDKACKTCFRYLTPMCKEDCPHFTEGIYKDTINVEEAYKVYTKGYTLAEVGSLYKRSHSYIGELFKRNNLKVRKKGFRKGYSTEVLNEGVV